MIKTPNESPGEIHPLALRQLHEKQLIAANWPIFRIGFEQYSRCRDCRLAVLKIHDDELRVYEYTEDEILALTVAHIANHHPKAFDGID